MQVRVLESRHKLSILTQEEEGGGLKEDAVVVVDLVTITKISKIKIMQKIQVVEEEEETREEGGALEAAVDGNKGITVTQMVVGYAAKQGTLQMSAITTNQMIGEMAGRNKETMHHHQILKMMGAYLLCSTC